MLDRWFVFLLLATGLAGCASAPPLPAPPETCGPPPMESPVMLSVNSGSGTQQRLLVHSADREEGTSFAVLDTLGAPQFFARTRKGVLQIDNRAIYRGADPQWLLRGWQWWQLRENLTSACVDPGDYRLRTAEGVVELLRRDRVHWRWEADRPDVYRLVQLGLDVTVRVLEPQ